MVTWSTLNSTEALGVAESKVNAGDEVVLTKGSFVMFGTDPRRLDKFAAAEERKFVDGGTEMSTQFIHTAKMKGLISNTTYCESVNIYRSVLSK